MASEITCPDPSAIDPQTGQPKTLVLLHGLFGRITNWESTWTYFKDKYRITAVDFDLYNPKAPYQSVQSLTDLTLRFMDQHQIARCVLFGNSLGGHVVLNLALKYPERVAAMVLTGSAGLIERGDSAVPANPNLEYLSKRTKEVFYDQSLPTEKMLEEVHDVLQHNRNKLRLIKLARSSRMLNMLDHLSEIQCPTLLVWGKQDEITPPEIGTTFANKMPHAKLFFIDKCGHAPNIEKPEELNAASEDFLKEIGY